MWMLLCKELQATCKKMATATLVTLILLIIVQIIAAFILINVMMDATLSEDSFIPTPAMLLPTSIVGYILIGLALLFSGIFTWDPKCGTQHV